MPDSKVSSHTSELCVSDQSERSANLRVACQPVLRRDPKEISFEALVATIRQRDAADKRATFWMRAFFVLTSIACTPAAGFVLVWMKGGW